MQKTKKRQSLEGVNTNATYINTSKISSYILLKNVVILNSFKNHVI